MWSHDFIHYEREPSKSDTAQTRRLRIKIASIYGENKFTKNANRTCGPPEADNVAPTTQPDKTGFHTSCLALYFSMTHSTPPNKAVKIPKFFAQPEAFEDVIFIALLICSRKGAWGTSLP